MSEVYKVRMTESVEFFIKANDEEQLQDWLDTHTIQEAKLCGDFINGDVEYNDKILFPVDGYADIDIT